MPSPFPGMDPYLEHPEWWPAVHTNLIVELQYALVPLLPAQYYVTIELREYGRYLEIRRPQTHELITVVEVLSPTNKLSGKGRTQYEEKRLAIAETLTNLVEIDLLRAGEPMPVLRGSALLPRSLAGDYRVLVARGARPRRAELHAIPLRRPLPPFSIPLRPGEREPEISLQSVLDSVYDHGAYRRGLDYRQEPVPPLLPEDAGWADHLLHEHGLR